MFLTTKSVFSNWNLVQLRGLYLNSEEVNYHLSEWVFREGEPSEYVYVIKKGEFHLCKNIEKESDDNADVMLGTNGLLMNDKQKLSYQKPALSRVTAGQLEH